MASWIRPLLGTAMLVLLGAPLTAVAAASRHECAPNQRSFTELHAPVVLPASHAEHGAHATHATASSVERTTVLSEGTQCSHCAHPHCATSQHCAPPAAVALSSRSAVLIAPATAIPGSAWVPDHPLSVNLAPPIPPPQTLL